jgi:hypothetical protein
MKLCKNLHKITKKRKINLFKIRTQRRGTITQRRNGNIDKRERISWMSLG